MRHFFVLGICIVLSSNFFSQAANTNFFKKNKWYISWGYNRSTYAPSDIRFEGPGYSFKLTDLKAKDAPAKFDPKVYFSPTKLTIPQFNLRAGYFISENISLSLGYDHMKYVVDNHQFSKITGEIDPSASKTFAGYYDNDTILINDDFLFYQHTDGLNYISFDVELHHELWRNKTSNLVWDIHTSAGAGVVVPKTWAILFGERGSDAFHLAGVGASINLGTRLYVYKHFYVHLSQKVGYLHLPDVATNISSSDRAHQNIKFLEAYFQFGWLFKI